MKKRLLLIALSMTMLFSSCALVENTDKIGEETENDEQIVVSETASQFYKDIYGSDTRPIAVMIDNDDESARPQKGLEDAYIVYEIIVEGGSTRFMALFKDKLPEKIGPIRSSRHYFIDYANENGAIYAHAGGSPKAYSELKSMEHIDGVALEDGKLFWRDNTYNRTWHNLYTSVAKLQEYAKKKGWETTAKPSPVIDYFENDTELKGEATDYVCIPYSPYNKSIYKYNKDTKLYERYINSKEHKTQTDNAVLTAKNIIVYQVQNVNLPDTENKGRQDLKNVGSGEGYYISNGVRQAIKWEKSSRSAKTVYTLSDGSELKINPGNTFIQIAPKGYEISFK